MDDIDEIVSQINSLLQANIVLVGPSCRLTMLLVPTH